MKHFFTSMTGHHKCLKCIGLHMVLECDFMKKVEIPTPSTMSTYIYIHVWVCILVFWAVSWQRTWAGQTSLDLSELTGTMKISGVFLLLSLALFCFFSGEFFSLKLKSNIYAELEMPSVFVHQDQFWEVMPMMIMTVMMKVVIVIMKNNFPLLSIHCILGM